MTDTLDENWSQNDRGVSGNADFINKTEHLGRLYIKNRPGVQHHNIGAPSFS